MDLVKRVLQEPLLHFFLIGVAIFALYYETDDKDDRIDNRSIVVTRGKISSIEENFKRVWSRNPTEKELDGLIQDYIEEEVLYREALALGLDKNDTVIRRRLRQKMEFLNDEILQQAEPSDQILLDYYAKNKNLFTKDPVVSFTHIYLNPEKHGANLNLEITKLLDLLEGKEGRVETDQYGDSILLENSYERSTSSVIAGLFGKTFADQVLKVPSGKWVGPIHSSYGVHVVFLKEKIDQSTPGFEEIREDVMDKWFLDQTKETKGGVIDKIIERYDVTIER